MMNNNNSLNIITENIKSHGLNDLSKGCKAMKCKKKLINPDENFVDLDLNLDF